MGITILSAVIIMAAYFLILYAGVGLIQDKRFFSSAPKENLDAIPDKKPERFRGAHALGWCLGVFAIMLFAGVLVLAARDGVRRGFGFFARYLVILYLMELYDIFFFDWVLFCHSGFFPHFYPELKGVVGPQMFGYNKKSHLRHFLLYLPASAALAGLYLLF